MYYLGKSSNDVKKIVQTSMVFDVKGWLRIAVH